MGQYCPKCFSNETFLASSSIVHVVINDMKMDPDHILFDPNQEGEVFKRDLMDSDRVLLGPHRKKEIFEKDLANQIKKFFAWSDFLRNKSPIKTIKVFSNNYRCINQCPLKGVNISVINDLISPERLMSVVKSIAKNHSIELKIDIDDLC